MPSYEYECATCGTFTEIRPIAERDTPAPCFICEGPAPRVISAPNLALMNPLSRMAATRNERSQHEPRIGVKSSCCSGPSCAHKKARPTKDGKPALRASTKKNRRPWMLGH
ncbi:MAG: FmdB family zinc ribbon protein [Chthoniobacteraceae bacterium]